MKQMSTILSLLLTFLTLQTFAGETYKCTNAERAINVTIDNRTIEVPAAYLNGAVSRTNPLTVPYFTANSESGKVIVELPVHDIESNQIIMGLFRDQLNQMRLSSIAFNKKDLKLSIADFVASETGIRVADSGHRTYSCLKK